jgi:hypothetical protein
VPAAEGTGQTKTRAKRARRLRCETCLEILTLRHPWDTMACSCGALLLSGRPARPTIHWLSRPGGGWSEIPEDDEAETVDEPGRVVDGPVRRLGFRAGQPG